MLFKNAVRNSKIDLPEKGRGKVNLGDDLGAELVAADPRPADQKWNPEVVHIAIELVVRQPMVPQVVAV